MKYVLYVCVYLSVFSTMALRQRQLTSILQTTYPPLVTLCHKIQKTLPSLLRDVIFKWPPSTATSTSTFDVLTSSKCQREASCVGDLKTWQHLKDKVAASAAKPVLLVRYSLFKETQKERLNHAKE